MEGTGESGFDFEQGRLTERFKEWVRLGTSMNRRSMVWFGDVFEQDGR
jgi:hypothetical protein